MYSKTTNHLLAGVGRGTRTTPLPHLSAPEAALATPRYRLRTPRADIHQKAAPFCQANLQFCACAFLCHGKHVTQLPAATRQQLSQPSSYAMPYHKADGWATIKAPTTNPKEKNENLFPSSRSNSRKWYFCANALISLISHNPMPKRTSKHSRRLPGHHHPT